MSGTSVADSPAGDYGPNAESYLDLASPLNLAGASGCELNFVAKTALGSGDAFVVDRSINGGSTWLRRLSVTGSTGTYRSFNVDLQANGQSSVLFSFGLESNGSSQGDGINVDDVTVNCATAPSGDATYRFLDGTSMASPHVAGAAGPLLGHKPSLTVEQLKAALLDTGDPVPALVGKTSTGKRLNINRAIRSPLLVVPPTARTDASSGVTATGAVLNGMVNPHGTATSSLFEYGTTTAYGSSTAPADAGDAGSDRAVTATIAGLSPSTTYHYRLVAVRGGERFPGADATFRTPAASATGTNPPGGTPPVVKPPSTVSLAAIVKGLRVGCTRSRGKFRCRVVQVGSRRVKLTLKKGRTIVARGTGKGGKVIVLKGPKAKPGRYKLTVTVFQNGKKASKTKRLRIR